MSRRALGPETDATSRNFLHMRAWLCARGWRGADSERGRTLVLLAGAWRYRTHRGSRRAWTVPGGRHRHIWRVASAQPHPPKTSSHPPRINLLPPRSLRRPDQAQNATVRPSGIGRAGSAAKWDRRRRSTLTRRADGIRGLVPTVLTVPTGLLRRVRRGGRCRRRLGSAPAARQRARRRRQSDRYRVLPVEHSLRTP